jgi:uncharacterized membrane protein
MHIDALLLSRFQFAWVIALHILLPAFTVGLSCFIATLEILWWTTRKDIYGRLSAFWIKIFAVSFGMGVVPVRHQLEPLRRSNLQCDRRADDVRSADRLLP